MIFNLYIRTGRTYILLCKCFSLAISSDSSDELCGHLVHYSIGQRSSDICDGMVQQAANLKPAVPTYYP